MREKSIRGKVVWSYIAVVSLLIMFLAMLWHERCVTMEIEAESDSIRIVHKEVSAVHHRITELAMRGETAMAWTDEDKQRYVSLLQEADSMFKEIKGSCKGYVQSQLIDSVSTLLHIKGQHLADLMEISGRHMAKGQELLDQLPKIAKRATTIKVEKRKKSGLAGLLGGKKNVTVVPSEADRTNLEELHSKIASRHEQRIKDIAIYTDSLRKSNSELNTKLSSLIVELDAQTQKAISDKENRIVEARTRTLLTLAGTSVIALIAIALLTCNISRELKRRRKHKEERERLIAELKQSNDDKDELIKTRRQIIQTVTHELRNPLTVVIGNAGMIEDGEDSDSVKNHANTIGKEGKRMSAMVDSLLNYFRLDSDKDSVEAKPFEIKTIGETLEMEFSQITADKMLSFDVRNNARSIVCGDAEKIMMIGCNLLSNAVKFTECGSVRLQMDYADDTLTMTVEDTGTGIPKDRQKTIFKPFERLSNAATKDGFGLGLSIVKRLTEIMDGTIELDSEKGKGCKFTVCIPIKHISDNLHSNSEAKVENPTYPCNVIAIDDSDILLATIKDMLTKAGMTCNICTNADELMAIMRGKTYDLIMTDLKMNGMDGYDILELLRMTDIGNSKTIPVIAVTASDCVTEEDLRNAGFDGMLSKPFSKSELINVVSKYAKNNNLEIKPDLSALLTFGDEKNVLKQLVEETTKGMDFLRKAYEERNTEKISDIVHQLRSSWILLKVDFLLKRLNNTLTYNKEWNDGMDSVISEVLKMGEMVIATAKAKL